MSMTRDEARTIVVEALADVAPEIDAADVSGAAPLTTGLDLDSMDVLSLLAAIEQRTGATIPEGAVHPDWGIDALAAYVSEQPAP